MKLEDIPKKHMDIIAHSLGVDLYNSRLSKLKRDKLLPKKFYRNYFCAGPGHSDIPIIDWCIERDLMFLARQESHGDYYRVTDLGQAMLLLYFQRNVSNETP